MSDIRIAAVSTEYVKVPPTANRNGSPVNPSGDTAEMAFTAVDVDPDTNDWNPADWELIGAQEYVRCLVGPVGGVALAKATYDIWIRVTDSPEVPVKKATNRLAIF